jgi:hypothetical protein
LLREAELKIVDRDEFLDSLVVLEEGMRHFYIRAMQLKAVGGKPEEVDANLLKAVDIAEKVMPYRHHRLAAISRCGILDRTSVPEPAGSPSKIAARRMNWSLNVTCRRAPSPASATAARMRNL